MLTGQFMADYRFITATIWWCVLERIRANLFATVIGHWANHWAHYSTFGWYQWWIQRELFRGVHRSVRTQNMFECSAKRRGPAEKLQILCSRESFLLFWQQMFRF